MTILSLTFFRRRQAQEPVDRLEPESHLEASTRVVSRLESMLARDVSSSEETTGTPSPVELVSPHPITDELADGSPVSETIASKETSAVSVMAPPEEGEVEPVSEQAPSDNDTLAALASLGLEPTTSRDNVAVRLMAALDDARAQAEARRLAEQEHDRVQHESRAQLDRLEHELADAVRKIQTEAVLRRAAEIELERVQGESSRRVAEMAARLEGLTAELSQATRKTPTVRPAASAAGATIAKVKRTTKGSKPRKARKPVGAAPKTRSRTKTAAAPKSKARQTSASRTKRTSTEKGVPSAHRAATPSRTKT